ncbi:hypothetical protein GOP47_0027776 [Adiantum capillus-veneris]|nr:hypothetical protein GOP47_0027776 [Adiantum capillus-veneris]
MASSSTWVAVALLHVALLMVQLGMSGYQIITRVALTGGMNLFTFAVYRGAIGLCFLIPAAFFLERNQRPPLTWALVGHFFLLGLTGVFFSQAFFLEGLTYTSPTFAAAIQNSIPAMTFVIAAAFGQERVHIKRMDGQAKVVGTVLCVIGATVMVFYKGPAVVKLEQSMSAPHDSPTPLLGILELSVHPMGTFFPLTESKSYQIGAFYLMGMCIAFSFWLVMQSPVMKQYPARLSVTAFTSFFGTLQLLILALCKERNVSSWIVPWGSQLLAVLYAGIVVSCLVFTLQMWCVQKGGAVLTAVYQPAQTIIVAFLTFAFLKENFYLGSLIGGLLIIGGLYLVTWGQGKERKLAVDLIPTSVPPCIDSSKAHITQIFLDNGSVEPALTEPLLEDKTSKPTSNPAY